MFRFLKAFVLVCSSFFVAILLMSLGALAVKIEPPKVNIKKNSILLLELEGIIVDGKKFLKDLRKYSNKDDIKGVLVRIDSPGGVVGASQEIYAELNRVREELKKPVVVSVNSVAASGGYYAAVAADQIITNPGSLMGSIGVIMEFVNLEDLYQWAKVKRYSIKTGPFKDSGTDTRNMTEAERMLFQRMVNEVQFQFKQAISVRRRLSREVVDKYSDGRIFTGATAVKLGFADQVGTYIDALSIVGQLAKLGPHPEVFKPKEPQSAFFELLLESKNKVNPLSQGMEKLVDQILRLKTSGVPLLLYPGAFGI